MSENKENPSLNAPVTERLCLARMETLRQEIKGIKTAVYVAGLAITLTLTVVQIVLRWFLR